MLFLYLRQTPKQEEDRGRWCMHVFVYAKIRARWTKTVLFSRYRYSCFVDCFMHEGTKKRTYTYITWVRSLFIVMYIGCVCLLCCSCSVCVCVNMCFVAITRCYVIIFKRGYWTRLDSVYIYVKYVYKTWPDVHIPVETEYLFLQQKLNALFLHFIFWC